jgi:hypothetical protein
MYRYEPWLMAATVFFALLILPTVLAGWLDERTVRGINPWIKPLKFQVAVVVYLGTLAWFATWLPERTRGARWWRPFLIVTVVSACYEIFWIMLASMFGAESHFNVATPLASTAYTLAGFFAVLLTAASGIMGYQFLRHPSERLAPGVQLGLALGLLLTFLGTLVVAGYLGGAPGHHVGGVASDADGLLVMGWSTEVGDLRVAHFFATHAMHAVPLLALIASRVLPAGVQRAVVWVVTGLYAALIVGTFVQALVGLPFNRLPF